MPKRQPIVRPMLLATVLAAGFAVVIAMAMAWCLEVVGGLFQPQRTREQYVVRNDGTPLIESYKGYDYDNRTYRTLEGEAISDVLNLRMRMLGGAGLAGPEDVRGRFHGLMWGQRVIVFDDPGRPIIHWYFVHDGRLHGAAYFAGYDSQSKLCVGYMGTQGYRPHIPPPDEWFSIDGRLVEAHAVQGGVSSYRYGITSFYSSAVFGLMESSPDTRPNPWSIDLLTDDGLVTCNFRERKTYMVVPAGDLSGFGYSTRAWAPGDTHAREPGFFRLHDVAIRTPSQVVVLDPQSGERRIYSIPPELAQTRFTFYERADGTALATTRRLGQRAIEERLVEFDAAGKVLFRHALAPQPYDWSQQTGSRTWYGALLVPEPLVGAYRLSTDLPFQYLRTGEAATYADALVKASREAIPAAIVVVVVSAVLAVLAFRRQRIYRLPRATVWAVFVFLGGVPGFLAYRFHRHWPVREACPSCGTWVPRDREACAECGTDFPRPAPKGIEVSA